MAEALPVSCSVRVDFWHLLVKATGAESGEPPALGGG